MLKTYRAHLQRLIVGKVADGIPNAKIRRAAVDAVVGGKMARSSIAFDIARALVAKSEGRPVRKDLEATHKGLGPALAVECVHASSLVLDDFKEFDDDHERRGKTSLHVAYGRPTSLLAVVALFSQASRMVALERALIGDSLACQLAEATAEAVHRCSDGQLGEIDGEADVVTLMAKKTGALFQLSFLTGWLSGGGAVDEMEAILGLGEAFGLVWQILDDLEDYLEDRAEGRRNFCLEHGIRPGVNRYLKEREVYVAGLKKRGIWTPLMQEMTAVLDGKLESHLRALIANGVSV